MGDGIGGGGVDVGVVVGGAVVVTEAKQSRATQKKRAIKEQNQNKRRASKATRNANYDFLLPRKPQEEQQKSFLLPHLRVEILASRLVFTSSCLCVVLSSSHLRLSRT